MKNTGRIIGVIALIAVIVGIRLYRKYDRQQVNLEKQRKQQEWIIQGQKRMQLEEQRKQDSIRLAQPTKLDSSKMELDRQRKKLQETLRKLEQQKE